MPAPSSSPRRFARYELTTQIGRGGSGEVHRARVLGGGRRDVALKLLRSDATSRDEKAVERFLREGRLGAMVRHPNVVRVIEVGRHRDAPFVAMELIDGPSLEELLAARGALPPRALLDCARQAALGLAALHDLGHTQRGGGSLVHRDIKPGNLLVDRRGCVKIADFGIALLAGRDVVTSVMGTLGYMAPEQIFGGELDGRADLFSLGATLFSLATGSHLFPSRPIGAAIDAVRGVDERLAAPGALSDVDAAVPGLGAVLARCLRLDPDDRFADAHAVWAALEPLGAGAGGPSLGEIVRAYVPRDAAASWRSTQEVSRAIGGPFVGRLGALERLRGVEGLVVVTGPPGIGKTRLARESFPDAVWVEAAGRDLDALGRALAAAFGFCGEVDLEQMLPLTRAETIAIDGLSAPSAEAAEALARWAEAAPRTRWIVTSRAPVGALPELPLRPLDDAAARALLAAWAPAEDAWAIGQLADRLGGLPLALELAGRSIASGRATDSSGTVPLAEWGLQAALEWSWRRASRSERHALAQLSVFEAPFSLDDAEAVVEPLSDSRSVGELVEALVARGLVRRGARVSLGPVLRDYAGRRRPELLGAQDERQLRLRHAIRFSALGSSEALHAVSGPRAREALDRLAAARADLEAALRWSLGEPGGTTSAHCCLALYALARAGRGAAPAPALFEQVMRRRYLQPLARVRLRVARAGYEAPEKTASALEQSERALVEAEVLGDPQLIAQAHIATADALVTLKRHADAKPHLESAWASARALGNRRLEVGVLRVSTRRLSRMGRSAAALERIRRASALSRSIGDPEMAAAILELEGLMLARLERRREAIPVLRAAAQELEALGSLRSAGRAWYNLDYAAAPLDRELAGEARARGIALLRAGGETRLAMELRLNQAIECADLGRRDEAAAIFEEVIQVARSRGLAELLAVALCDRVCHVGMVQDWDAVERWLPEAAAAIKRHGSPFRLFVLGYLKARLDIARGRLGEPPAQIERLVRYTERREDTYGVALIDHLRGLLAEARGDAEGAILHLERALIGLVDTDPSSAVEVQGQRAALLFALSRQEEARLAIASGRALARERQIEGGPGARWLDRAEAMDRGAG